MTKVETTIPFAGFYNSIHSEELDHALEMIFSDSSGNPINALVEKAFDKVDWTEAHNLYARAYVKALAKEVGLKTLTFKLIDSPKYYNYTTDRIFCEMEQSEFKEIFNKTDKDKLQAKIRATFTSYDGFISHYRNDLEEWSADIEEWDHNQLGTLLSVYIEQVLEKELGQMEEFDLFCSNSSDVAYNSVADSIKDAEKLFKVADYLRVREERSFR